MNDSLISVIIPVYKVEQYLDRCITSVVNQSYTNLEIVLVNDGSPDNSDLICRKWESLDKRIKVYKKENGGLSSARNFGLDHAHGDYVAFVDSDDYIEVDMYKTMLDALHENDCSIACCGRIKEKNDSMVISKTLVSKTVLSPKMALNELLTNGCVEEACWDKLYSMSLFETVRFPEGEINEDLAVIPWILHNANRIVHVGKPFYHYCYNDEGISKGAYTIDSRVIINHLNSLEHLINTMYPELSHNLSIIKSKYSMNTLLSILLFGLKKIYHKDYLDYKNILKHNYKALLKSNNYGLKTKLECYLLVIGLYYPLWYLKHCWEKE